MSGAEILTAIIGALAGALSGLATAAFRLGKYHERIESLTRRVDEAEKEIKATHHELIECRTKLDERTQTSPAKYAKRSSPMKLTPDGESLLKRSGGDVFIASNKDELVGILRDTNPKSAYDVQENAKKVFEKIQNEDRFIPFKNFAFKEGLDLDIIFLVLGLHLRDIAMPLLGFKMEDLDRIAAQ